MVGISFSVKKEEILSGVKQCTIRKPRQRPWKTTDILNLYWKARRPEHEHLFDVPVQKVTRILFKDFTEELAKVDGFDSLLEMQLWFIAVHGKYMAESRAEKNGWSWVQHIENAPFDWIQWDYNKREVSVYE
jgi:hypothetical protein